MRVGIPLVTQDSCISQLTWVFQKTAEERERESEIGDNEARKEEKSEESCCARPQEKREEVSP